MQAALSAIQSVEKAGGKAYYYQVDLRDPKKVGSAMAEIAKTGKKIDILLHAGGLEISRVR